MLLLRSSCAAMRRVDVLRGPEVEKALGTRTIDSWAAVFDPAVASKLGERGIATLDSGSDILSVAKLGALTQGVYAGSLRC